MSNKLGLKRIMALRHPNSVRSIFILCIFVTNCEVTLSNIEAIPTYQKSCWYQNQLIKKKGLVLLHTAILKNLLNNFKYIKICSNIQINLILLKLI